MPVFALYNFDDVGTNAMDSALGNGAQNGIYVNGAVAAGGQAVLDGVNDLVKIYPDASFQMDRGTLDIAFTLGDDPLTDTQTVLSRDSAGQTNGGYRIEILANGSVVISHETPTGTETFGTAPGFAAPGDSINLSYSWDQGGDGGQLLINNTTTGGSFADTVPDTLSMDMSGEGINQPWIVGAGQSTSSPNLLNNIDQHFQGSVSMFQLSDTVDNNDGLPHANPDEASTPEDTSVIIPVLSNDVDDNGQPLTVTTATAPNGTVVINADGTVTYTPDENFNGEDTITYTITDPDGNLSSSTVTVTVSPVNDAPVAEDDASSTALNTPVTFAVMGNDSDVDGDPLSIVGTPTSANGTVVVNGDGTLTFTPTAGFTGAATVDYTVTDPEGLTATATWTITVGDTGGPVANPDEASTPEDTSVIIPVLSNDVDDNGQPLTVTTATAPNGTVVINADGTVTYTPDENFNGEDTITYTITDPDGNLSSSTVTVTVSPVNDAPMAEDDASSTALNTPVTFAVMGNDSDVDGDPLSIVGTPTSANGTVVVNGDGTLTFTPTAGFTGAATVDYTVTDPEGLTATATWTITVGDDANSPPVAEDDSASTALNTPVTIAVMANDSDPDGDIISIVGTPTSPNGTVVVNGDGTITFTPTPGFVGEATIDYLITDNNGGTDPAVVTVTVVDGGGRDGIVRGTTGDDLINATYPNDNDGDFVDRGDAILPGDAPNDDRILAGAGNDTVFAGKGNDSVEGGTGNDVINGQNGDDTLFGQDGNDTLIGQNGDDTIYGGNGRDSVRGGTGNDVIDTSGDPTPLPDKGYPGIYPSDLDPNDDRDTVYGGAGDDTIRTGDDADVIGGGYGNDLIDAGFDDDTIDGNQGNDTIIGGEGNDLIDGGQGDDLIYGGYAPNVPDAVNIPDDGGDLRPDNGRDNIFGGMGNDTIFGMDDDDTIHGGLGNDVIDGGIDDDLIYGEQGNDALLGSQGNDTVYGGQGNDTINGGAGVDSLSGDADRDTFVVGSAANGAGDVVFGGAGGDDYDILDLTGTGPYRLTGVTPDSDGNGIDGTVEFLDADGNVTGSMVFTNIEEIIPCFTPGTLIATPKGEVAVENLKAGDRIITRDNGIQEIRWTGQKALGWKDFAANPHLKPVLIRQGSLGNGLPERDMMVSPNHRMLVANDRTALYFDEHEVLVSAKHLVAAQGIQSIDSVATTYIHFMFDRHEVVLSNGAWTESFQPGDYTLKGMGNAQRNEIFELFPELKTEAGLNDYQAARRTLKRHEAVLLVK